LKSSIPGQSPISHVTRKNSPDSTTQITLSQDGKDLVLESENQLGRSECRVAWHGLLEHPITTSPVYLRGILPVMRKFKVGAHPIKGTHEIVLEDEQFRNLIICRIEKEVKTGENFV